MDFLKMVAPYLVGFAGLFLVAVAAIMGYAKWLDKQTDREIEADRRRIMLDEQARERAEQALIQAARLEYLRAMEALSWGSINRLARKHGGKYENTEFENRF